jgi:hypothetical protein
MKRCHFEGELRYPFASGERLDGMSIVEMSATQGPNTSKHDDAPLAVTYLEGAAHARPCLGNSSWFLCMYDDPAHSRLQKAPLPRNSPEMLILTTLTEPSVLPACLAYFSVPAACGGSWLTMRALSDSATRPSILACCRWNAMSSGPRTDVPGVVPDIRSEAY